MQSDLAFIIFPGQTALEIFPPGHDLYLHHEIVADCPDIRGRVKLDAKERDRFVPDAPILSDLHEHNQFIGDDVRNCIGLSYRDAVGVLADLITRCEPAPDGFPIPLVHKGTAIERLAAFLHFPTAAVERALSGFTISRAKWKRSNENFGNLTVSIELTEEAFLKCLILPAIISSFLERWLAKRF